MLGKIFVALGVRHGSDTGMGNVGILWKPIDVQGDHLQRDFSHAFYIKKIIYSIKSYKTYVLIFL